jgi:hypothetical protein
MCVNLTADPSNCGACGRKCATGESCNGGTCGTTQQPNACRADTKECIGTDGKPFCAPVFNDPSNCGECGRVCAPGQGCNNGQCMNGGAATDGGATQTCPQPNKFCPDQAGGQYCANVMYDRNNCGQCGRLCAANEMCNNGQCVVGGGGPDAGVTCPAGFLTCAGRCVDPYNDTNNCGFCGNICQAGYYCMGRECIPQGGGQADAGPPKCAGEDVTCFPPSGAPPYCASLQTDPWNCGQCFKMCTEGDKCQEGVCVPPVGI